MAQDVINCPQCNRTTPAARGACLYCGADLPTTELRKAPPQRALEPFERAFNVVADASGVRDADRSSELLAAALTLEQEEATGFATSGKQLPVARCKIRQEAEMTAALVRSCGLGAKVVPDDDLQLEIPLNRAHKLELQEGLLVVSGVAGTASLSADEIRLMVVGGLRRTRVDYSEGTIGLRGKAAVMESAEFRSEDVIVDVYAGAIEKSFRIKVDSFDYSGLVSPMSFRAEINFRSMLAALRQFADRAPVDEDFLGVRHLLVRAWPERSRSESRGIRRTGVAYRPVARSSVTSDNQDQFERYSRLMFLCVSQGD